MDELTWWLIVGGTAGLLAGAVMKGGGFGLVGNGIVGVVGALTGGFLFKELGVGGSGLAGDLITAFVGSVVLLFVMGFVKKGD